MTIMKALDTLKDIAQAGMIDLLITKDKIKILSDPTKSDFDVETIVTIDNKDYIINTELMTVTDAKNLNNSVTLPKEVNKSIINYVFYPTLQIRNIAYIKGNEMDKLIEILNDTLCIEIIANHHVIRVIDDKISYDVTLLTPVKNHIKKTINLNIKIATIEKLMQDLNDENVRIVLAYITLNNLFVNILRTIDSLNNSNDKNAKNELKALFYLSEKIEKAMKDLTDSYYLDKTGVIYQYELLIKDDLLSY